MPTVAAGQMMYECHCRGIQMREYPLAGENIRMSEYSDHPLQALLMAWPQRPLGIPLSFSVSFPDERGRISTTGNAE